MVAPKKHLGQHFLTNPAITDRISKSIQFIEFPILEIGPGKGILTKSLLQCTNNIKVIEIDGESVEFLLKEKTLSREQIIQQDFLKADLSQIFENQFVLVGNFPYNISSQIIFKGLDFKERIPEIVGMFQKEVAVRIAAKHGNKQYGILSVLSQAYYETKLLFDIQPGSFFPPPKVMSTVISLKRRTELPDVDYQKLRRVVKAAFNLRRKTLRNALRSAGFNTSEIDDKVLSLRAEQIPVQGFIELTNSLFPTN